MPLGVASICLAGTLVFVLLYVPRRFDAEWRHWEENLSVRAEARRSAISAWVEREKQEAAALASLPAVRELVQARDDGSHAHAAEVLAAFGRAHAYRLIAVLDTAGRPILIARNSASPDTARLRGEGRAAMRAGPTSADLVRYARDSTELYFGVQLTEGDRSVGVLLFVADPAAWLYPFLALAHSATSSEALLIQVDGDSLTYLTVSDGRVAVVRAAAVAATGSRPRLGVSEPFGRYRDQHNNEVMGLALPIGGLGWSVALKVDYAVALGGFWKSVAAQGVLWALLMIFVSITVLSLWWGQRKATEAAFALQRTRFARALDHARDAMLIASVDGRILDVNIAMERLCGRTRDQLIGRHLADDSPRSERDTARRALAEVLRSGETVCDSSVRSIDGRLIPVEVSGRTSMLDDDRVIIAIVRDISERRASEQREQRLNRILRVRSEINQLVVREHDPASLWQRACAILVEHGDFLLTWILLAENDGAFRTAACCGPAVSHATGRTLRWDDSPLGAGPCGSAFRSRSTVIASVHDDEHAEWRERARAGGLGSCAAVPLSADGQVFGVIALYLADPDAFTTELCSLIGELGGDLGFALAAIERRTALSAAQTEAARSAAALEQAADVAIITDLSGTIVQVNPAFERITGYSRQEAIGCNPRMLQSGRQPPAFYADMWRTLKQGDIWSGELINRRKDGTFYTAEVVISPVRGPEGTVVHYVGLQRDVSEERALADRLRQVQRVEELGKLTGGIAHDFNNLLTVVLSNISLAESELDNDLGAVRDYMADIGEAARKGGAMVRKLLAVGRQGRLVLATVNPGQIVTDAERMLRRVIPENVEIFTEIDSELPSINADSGAVEQMLLNLATNARDAMPQGGRLVLRVRTHHVAAAAARAEAVPPGDYVVISADDSGMGMDEATQRRVFEPFFTTKPVGKGTGLGLAMVFGLVRQHGGFIHIESAPGQGTSMQLCFPATTATAEATCQASAAPPAKGGIETILLVEDEAPLRLAATRLLSRIGYTVVQASHGEEAWDLFRRDATAFDLVLSDAVMPKMSGLALLARIRESGSTVPFLLTSGYAEGVTDAPGDLPVPEILAKPWNSAELSAKVREILDGAREGALS